MDNGQIYLVDTCVLVNIRDIHNDSADIWDCVRASIQAGKTKTVRQVFRELQTRFPMIHKRLKDLKPQFVIPDAITYDSDVTDEISAIITAHPRLYDRFGSGNPADPFLIAVAKCLPGIVVTDEKRTGPKHKTKIPFVCTSRNVGNMTGIDFLRKIGANV